MPIPACILLILAHPDDESFFAAGLARRHVERGAKVALVTATRGDAGQVGDPPLCDRDALPALREAELREAADILGISEVHLLDYQDTRLAEAPIDQIRCELVALIRRHRPHVVITFDRTAKTVMPTMSRFRGSRRMPWQRPPIRAGRPNRPPRTWCNGSCGPRQLRRGR